MQGDILVMTPRQFQQLKAHEGMSLIMSNRLLYISEGPPKGITEVESQEDYGSYLVVGLCIFLLGVLVGRK